MLTVRNNLFAMNASRLLGRSYNALADSVERLSSGLRINGAKDDAAGLADGSNDGQSSAHSGTGFD